jgi:hypothetical protein
MRQWTAVQNREFLRPARRTLRACAGENADDSLAAVQLTNRDALHQPDSGVRTAEFARTRVEQLAGEAVRAHKLRALKPREYRAPLSARQL